jgi:ribosomal protein S9
MKKYKSLLKILQQLNRIQPEMVPNEVRSELAKFLRPGNPYATQIVPRTVDENGRARAKGKRKESTAVVQLVEGEGEIVVNGKSLVEMFQRVHDRESALWALRSTQRMDKYNAWITVKGGGVTGQAEAITLAIARALLLHEPGLKPALRKGELFPGYLFGSLLIVSSSRCHYCRCSSRGEEEARPCQGPQDAHLGQAVNGICASDAFSLSIMYYFTIHGGSSCLFYILYSMHMGPSFNDIVHHTLTPLSVCDNNISGVVV